MSATDAIASELRGDMLAGRIGPGEELRQEEIARRFGVSRMPVRDALGTLAAARLVALRPNRGARVVRLSASELTEIGDLRVLLECDALRRATPGLVGEALEAAEHEMARCEIEAGRPGFPEADWRFHLALYAPSGRVRQIALIEELRALSRMHAAAYDALRRERDRWSEHHREIVRAVRAGDADAASAALSRHLREAGACLAARMEEGT